VLRAIAESGRTDIEVVGINDLGPVETTRICCASTRCMAVPRHGDVKGDTISIGNGP